jgi:hypothetical protein
VMIDAMCELDSRVVSWAPAYAGITPLSSRGRIKLDKFVWIEVLLN